MGRLSEGGQSPVCLATSPVCCGLCPVQAGADGDQGSEDGCPATVAAMHNGVSYGDGGTGECHGLRRSKALGGSHVADASAEPGGPTCPSSPATSLTCWPAEYVLGRQGPGPALVGSAWSPALHGQCRRSGPLGSGWRPQCGTQAGFGSVPQNFADLPPPHTPVRSTPAPPRTPAVVSSRQVIMAPDSGPPFSTRVTPFPPPAANAGLPEAQPGSVVVPEAAGVD